MALEQTLITWAHLVSASIWVGGSIFLGVVLAPLLKKIYPSHEKRIELMILVGRRFNKIALPSLGILIATGIYSARGVLADPSLLASGYGGYLAAKIVLVALLVVLFAVHVRIIRPGVEQKIMSGEMPAAQLQALRKRIIILGEATVIVSVAILFLAAVLDSGL